jgi:cytochrome c-type biogenesis protein CcmH/NrfG
LTEIALWQHVEAAFALSLAGDHAEAARAFEAVLALDPDNLLALKFLGARALETGDLTRAVTFNERVAASGLHTADALSNLVLAYDRLGRREDALRAATRALEADPDHVAARFNRAVVLTAAGKSTEALQDLERVVALDPRHGGASALRAQLHSPTLAARVAARRLAGEGNLPAAIRRLDEAVAANAQDVELHDELGVLRMQAGDVAGARAAFERATALAPERLDVRERLAAALHRAGDRRQARFHFAAVTAASPSSGRAPRGADPRMAGRVSGLVLSR